LEALKTILYFSIFRYPLNINEINSYTNHKDLSETKDELNQLIERKIIIDIDGFHVYGNDLESVTKRIKGNIQAKKAMIIAKQRAKFISKFPFVKAVGISGSLSKGYYDEDSDIDFFVITKDSKLWICRTLLMLYKKLFLLNSRKYFCVNYFISETQLEIEEKNRFTATELKTLIPLEGKSIFEAFYKNNQWVNEYFSNFQPKYNSISSTEKPYFTVSIEFLMNNKVGNGIDYMFKIITLKKWNSKFHYLNEDDFKIALKSTKNISKHHPSNFQKKVITALNEKIDEVQIKFKIELAKEYV
jgi:predicted nucleotidyltransferase